MKNLKKVLALVIVFAMMMSTAAFAGSVFPDVADDATYASAVATLSQLGLFTGDDKGNFNPDATITRAEYAVIMTRLAGITAAGTADFTDVPATHWATGYINAATQNGLIVGHGDGKFGPDDPVTYEQAVTMLIRALGYEPLAVSKGGYPAGYLSVASQYGLLAGVSGTTGAGAPRSTVAVMTYNALDIPVVEQTGFGTDVQYTIMKQTDDQDKVTLLTRLNIYKLGGVAVANAKVAYIGTATDKGYVDIKVNDDYDNPVKALRLTDNKNGKLVSGAVYQYRDEKALADDKMAVNAVFYLKEYASNKYDVVAVELEDGTTDTLTIDAADFDLTDTDFDEPTVKYYKDGASKATTIKLEPNAENGDRNYSVVINNTVIDGADFADFKTDFANDEFTGSVEFIDWDNNNKYDIIKFTVYKHVMVEEVSKLNGKISVYNASTGFSKIDLAVDEEDAVVSVKDVNGKEVDYTTLKEYDVLAVVVSPYDANPSSFENYNSLEVIVLGDSKVTGTMKGSSTVNGIDYITIDGKKYEMSKEDIYTENTIENGCEGDFFIGIDGKVVGFAGSKAANGNYGFIISAYAPTGSSTANISILTKEGKVKTFNYASKVKFVNAATDASVRVSVTDGVEAVNAVTGAWTLTGANVKRALATKYDADVVEFAEGARAAAITERFIKYDVNSEGAIDEIIVNVDNVDVNDEYDAGRQKLDKLLADDIVIFNIDWDDINDSTVKDVSFLVDEDAYTGVVYDKNDDNEYGALVLKTSDSTFAAGTPLTLVKSVEETEDDNGDKIFVVEAIVAGESKTLKFYDDDVKTKEKITSVGADALDFGDILLANTDSNGVVSAFAVVGSVNNLEFAFNADFLASAPNTDDDNDDAYYLGVYVDSKGKTVDIKDVIAAVGVEASETSFLGLSGADQYYYKKSGRNDVITIGDSISNVDKASENINYLVLIRTNNGSIQEIVAFDKLYTDAQIADMIPDEVEEAPAAPAEEVVAPAPVEEEVTELTDVEIEL